MPHADGLAFTEAAGLALASVFLSYNAFIQEWTVKLCRPLYGTSVMRQKQSESQQTHTCSQESEKHIQHEVK